eukprot:2466204-Amphidinium_carterae.1
MRIVGGVTTRETTQTGPVGHQPERPLRGIATRGLASDDAEPMCGLLLRSELILGRSSIVRDCQSNSHGIHGSLLADFGIEVGTQDRGALEDSVEIFSDSSAARVFTQRKETRPREMAVGAGQGAFQGSHSGGR